MYEPTRKHPEVDFSTLLLGVRTNLDDCPSLVCTGTEASLGPVVR